MNRHNGSTTTKVSPSSPMNRTTKVWFTFHYRYSFEAESGAFQQQSEAQPTKGLGAPERLSTTIRGTTHNGIGGSRTASSDHTRVQPPQRRLGSKDPRVTSSSSFQLPRILVESTPMHQMQKARAQVLKSSTLKFQQSNKCLWGNKRGRTKRRTPNYSKI